jgi:uncharacterized protein YggE
MKTKSTILAALIILLAAWSLQAQTKVVVEGQSSLEVIPDECIVRIQLEAKEKNTASVMQSLNKQKLAVIKLLTSIGYSEGQIQTADFQIRPNMVYTKEKYEQDGFVGNEAVKIRFVFEKEFASKLLTAFGDAEHSYPMNIQFLVSDSLKKAVAKQQLEEALSDAKNKVEVIAAFIDLKPGMPLEIQTTGGSQPVFKNIYMERSLMAGADAPVYDSMNPETVKLSQNIKVIWELINP